MNKLVFFLGAFLILFSNTLPAETNSFIQYKTQDGLSFNTVDHLAEDDEGFIYACTNFGLNIFNGSHFAIYDQNNTPGFSNKVSIVLPMDKGYVLIGTIDKGLYLFNKYKEKIIPVITVVNNKETLFSVSVISKDKQGNIWLGCENGKLYCTGKSELLRSVKQTQPSEWTFVTQLSGPIDALSSFEETTLVGASNEKITRIKKVANEFIIDYPLEISNISKIYGFTTYNHSLFIGTDIGLYRLENIENLNYNLTIRLEHPWKLKNHIIRSLSTHKGYIWTGTEGNGLYKLNINDSIAISDQFIYSPKKRNSIGSNYILCSFIDSNENLWIGTWFGGINMMDLSDPNYSFIYNKDNENNLFSNITWCIEEKDTLNYWIGTHGNGLCTYNIIDKNFKVILKTESIQSISSIYYSKALNLLFIGTWGNGLKILNTATNKWAESLEKIFANLKGERIYALTEGPGKRLWIGSFNKGLYQYHMEDQTLTRIPLKIHNQTQDLDIRHIKYDHEQNIMWVSSLQNGLFRLSLNNSGDIINSKHYLNFKSTNEPISIESVHKANDSALWLNSRHGLGIIKNNESPILLEPLKGIITTGMIMDQSNNFWISTYSGVYRFKKDQTELQSILNEYAFHDITFNSDNNFILAASDNGLLRINPAAEMELQKYPSIVLSEFKVFNQLITPDSLIKNINILPRKLNYCDTIILPYFCQTFSFGVHALTFSNNSKEKIRFRLEGFENSWHDHNNISTTVSYTNLPPGTYVFRAQPINKYNNLGPTKELIIIKKKPWWGTHLAFTAYALIVIALIYIIAKIIQTRVQMKQELKFEKVKQEQDHELYQQKLNFFTNISHDVRTPLTLIIGPLEEIAQTKDIQQEFKTKVERMLKNAKMLLNLFNQVLDFRKMETDNLTLKYYQINLKEFVEKVFYQFKELAGNKHIDFEMTSPEEEIVFVTDPPKLESILFNLISNALKFTPTYGQIWIEIQKSENLINLIIKDTGTGISERDLQSIFTRFYRSDNNYFTQGSGIGLALVKKYVEMMDGEINVKSTINKGTEFQITFTLNKIPSEYEEYQSGMAIKFKKTVEKEVVSQQAYEKTKTILVIDDNQDIRDYLNEILSQQYTVISAPNGYEGLALTSRKNPDLVICDIMMEGMDGLSVCEQIKTNLNTSHIPVILLTAKNTLETKAEGFEKGADAYIEKPFNSQLLLIRIKSLIEHRQLLKKKFTLVDSLTRDVSPTSVDERFIKQVIEVIEKNITDSDFSVKSLVEQLPLGQDQLYRKIKALTGLSINHFIRSIRLKKAAQLLKSKNFNVSEVMFQVGFNNPSYFTKCFKTEYGMLPSEFINSQ